MSSTKQPTRLILHPLDRIDPRAILDDRALIEASNNAYPIVAQARRRKDGAGLLAGSGIALLLGGLTFWSMSGHRTARPAPPPRITPAQAFIVPGKKPVVAPPSSLLLPSVPSVANQMALAPNEARQPAPIMVFDTSSAPLPAPVASAAPAVMPNAPAAPRTANVGSGENEQFAARAGDGEVQVASAHRLTNPAQTVTQGTLIAAVLETAIDTDLPGYARALVSRDVRSFDGSQVLIPRSSRLIGQYKSGLAAGQTRAYIIWTRIIRPDGVSVALGSPAVDFSGSAGLTGKVDGHFMKRFGSAVLLTVVGGVGALASSGTSVVLSSGGQSAASVAAQRDTAIPPTIRVAQGQPIRIFTARDLDFSTVGTEGVGE
ncbi:TrbI/VirB10 family protein [Sphingomonas nostoxanthinifaciens]|uniref:TrbI/VirB10 family protein n=1 Tax=Sphingomonas nostoxanthinifaciens TaxID=2872652 RepID=UPI001CC21A5F|nr:TrbI/VirB10 family protein [Sphingomonas nostoxanthinifaciens]UAK23163.1 type VI secretion protein [Sphingomonas nostoxanthinifaciens]